MDFNLYNQEIKEKFLNELENLNVRKITSYPLRKAERTERLKDKDLYDMTLEEIETVMYDATFSSELAAYGAATRIEHYIDWAAENGYRKSNITPFHGVDKVEWSKNFVATYMRTFFTREQILEMCDDLYNNTDKAILLAIFEGIKGTGFSEILSLKFNDEDIYEEDGQYYANLKSKDKTPRIIPISNELYKLLDLANREYEYVSRNGVDVSNYAPATKYAESEYIFKKLNRGKQGGELNKFFINRKFQFYKEVFGLKYLKAKNIEDSGMMHMANELYKRDGEIGQKQIYEIGDRFDSPLAANDSKKYRNATVIKSILEIPDFEAMYGYSIDSKVSQ